MMEIEERISILTQGVELAQKAGALTLSEAYNAKIAIDVCNSQNGNVSEAIGILIGICEKGQRCGIYTLRDAHFIFLATYSEDIE